MPAKRSKKQMKDLRQALAETAELKSLGWDVRANLVEVRRQTNGYWTIDLKIRIVVSLPDGRNLRTEKVVSLGRIKQEGRRKA